ncbi:maoc family protein [hydrocarbon metagenome]|uniref:Maoc family protein n=1 Tax=hydrocarbon metagenome TaxID=938273 RepID=A0A0W8FLN7_9ZZZZ
MAPNYDDIEVGHKMPVYTSAPITRTHLVRYAGASGDFNPLHHDQTFIKMIGMKNVIAHGMLIMGIAGEAVTSWIENKYLRKFNARFLSMTEPADMDDMENTKDRAIIIVSGEIVKKFEENGEKRIQCDIIAQDALGSKKLSGFFIAALP